MLLIPQAIKLAKENYSEKGFDHALRVAEYASENKMIKDKDTMDTVYALAILHDLVEDTNITIIDITTKFNNYEPIVEGLKLLTKEKGADYIKYIKKIKSMSCSYPEAYWVKLADMKDHLAQTDTLTDRLKEKYLTALPYLL